MSKGYNQIMLVLYNESSQFDLLKTNTARKLAICTDHWALFVPVEAIGTSWPVLNAGYFSTGRSNRY